MSDVKDIADGYKGVIIDKHVLMDQYSGVSYVLIMRDADGDVFDDNDVPANVYYETDCAIGNRVRCFKSKDGGFFGDNEYKYVFERGTK